MKPKVICLCGSTRFKKAFEAAEQKEALMGNITLGVGFYGHADCISMPLEDKASLDELHLRKIDLADEILVLNKGGYIGNSTRREISYAGAHDKPIRYLEEVE